jgi:hypothetical protein
VLQADQREHEAEGAVGETGEVVLFVEVVAAPVAAPIVLLGQADHRGGDIHAVYAIESVGQGLG